MIIVIHNILYHHDLIFASTLQEKSKNMNIFSMKFCTNVTI